MPRGQPRALKTHCKYGHQKFAGICFECGNALALDWYYRNRERILAEQDARRRAEGKQQRRGNRKPAPPPRYGGSS